MKIVVVASGTGSNFVNIANHFKVDALITNKPQAKCREYAQELGVKDYVIENNDEFKALLIKLDPDLICLAGYMRIIPTDTIDLFSGKIINIHPSLLPKHRGLHAFETSFECDDILGVTVHYVDNGLDTGEIIQQSSFKNTKDYESSLTLLKEHEHQIYLDVINKIIK